MMEIIDSIFKWRDGVAKKGEEKEINKIPLHPPVSHEGRNGQAGPSVAIDTNVKPHDFPKTKPRKIK